MAWDTPRVNGDIHYAADHNTEIDEIKSKALLVGGTLDGNLMSGTTPVLFDIAFPRNATPAVGSIFWEADNETATIQLHADCDLPIGLRELRRVYNPTGSTMLKGSAVYTNGIGGTPTVVAVALAQANATATSIVLGVLSDDIEATHTGFCTVRGHVCIDTSAFDGAAGDSLYLSETVAGGLTSTPPISPNLLIRMGRLIVKDVEPDGKINVRLTTLYALGTLSDVSVPSPVANQILKFNGVSWVAADTTTVSSAGGTDFYLTGNHANPIVGISRAAAAVVTWTGHGQSTGASCAFWGITQADWTALNSTAAVPIWYKITVTSVDAFTIAVNTSGYAAPYNPAVDNGTVSIGILQNSPDTAIVTQTDSADAGSSTGEVPMTTFQTPLPLGRTVLTGGEWVFKTWCYASSATDVNTIVIRVYKRDTAGAETQLFYAETADLGIVNTLSQITVINGSFATLVTDHLVVKYFAKSNRAAAGVRRLYLTHNGTDKYSFVKTPLSLSHASLDFLQYSNAGHVGFAPSNPLATDTLWDAAGDMVIGTGPNTAHKLVAGATTTILKGGGAADPVWTTVTGTGAPVCAISPALTSVPTAPTAAVDTDSTQIATTAFVNDQIEQGTKPTTVVLSDAPVSGGIFNGGFDIAPAFTAVQTASGWIDGTATGSATNDSYGWYLLRVAAAISARFDPYVTHSGGCSLKISTTDTIGGAYCCNFNAVASPVVLDLSRTAVRIKPSTAYRIHVWIKTLNAYTNSAYINLIQYDSAGVSGTNIDGTKYTGTYDWFEYVHTFTSDNDAAFLRVAPAVYASGAVSDVWFDDIWVEETISDTTFTGTVPTPIAPIISGVTVVDAVDQALDSAWTYTNHYTCPAAVNEGATHRQTFQPVRGKIAKISVNLLNGPDTLYLQIHDSSNVILASGSLVDPGVGIITFDTSCVWSSGELHFHVLSASGALQIATNTHEDLEVASYIQWYAKPTCSPKIVCNGNVINLKTPVEGILHGSIIDLDCGTYLYNGITAVTEIEKIQDVYSTLPGGRADYTSYGYMLHNGHIPFLSLGLVGITSNTGAVERAITYKVNTLLPIKHLRMRVKIYSNAANDKLFQISSDNLNWVTLWTLNGVGYGRTSANIETDAVNGLSTFYIRSYKAAASNDYCILGIHYIQADLDTSEVSKLIAYPVGVANQFTETVTLPATADRIYLRYLKYNNSNGVPIPHLEFCTTATPVAWVPLKIDNIGEANPAIKIIAAETNTCTVGTGTDEGGNFILNNGEYVTITTPATSIKVTYQVGTGTTAFTNITMNRFQLSENGPSAASTLGGSSNKFNFYVGMRKEGTQYVLENELQALNKTNYSYFKRDCTLSLTGYAINQSVTDSYLRIAAGTQGQSPFPPAIQLNGPNKSSNPGLIILQVPNAAKSAVVNAMTITGVVDIPVVTFGTFNIYDATNTSVIARNVDTGFLDVRAGVNASAACLRLSGKDDATSGRNGGFALYVTDAAETSVKALMYADGATDTPVLNMNTFRIGNVGAPTTANDALTHQAWAAWTPTLVWTTGTPSPITTTARWTQVGKIVFFTLFITSSDSNGCTNLTFTLPVTPANAGGYTLFTAFERYGTVATYKSLTFYSTNNGSDTLARTTEFQAASDGYTVQVTATGFYEVA